MAILLEREVTLSASVHVTVAYAGGGVRFKFPSTSVRDMTTSHWEYHPRLIKLLEIIQRCIYYPRKAGGLFYPSTIFIHKNTFDNTFKK